MSAAKVSIGKGGMITYRYSAGSDMRFAFHLFCEVGEPYKAEVRAAMAARGIVRVETRELDAAPWIADFAVEVQS